MGCLSSKTKEPVFHQTIASQPHSPLRVRRLTRCADHPHCRPWQAVAIRIMPSSIAQVILRHSERLDHVDPNYMESEIGKAWPFDPPLTEKGIELAKKVALELLEVHKKAGFTVVASSPYHRCMQTAAEVAKCLKLPMLIDQEVGEVWEKAMPSDTRPHRSPPQLLEMTTSLGVMLNNPLLPEDGIKLLGRAPEKHGETTEEGHKRCTARVEHYIEQSSNTKQNFIIVSHAPAVAALADMFQRGRIDINKLSYCSYVIADREIPKTTSTEKISFADHWNCLMKGVSFDINIDATDELYEKILDETQERVYKRTIGRTSTDHLFDGVLMQGNDKKKKKNKKGTALASRV